MGGKGGGGGGGGDGTPRALDGTAFVIDPDWHGTGGTGYVTQAEYDEKYNKPEPIVTPEIKKVEEAPVVEEKKVEEPVVEEAKPIGDPIATGGAVDQPKTNTGDLLGGSVLNPPKYWTDNKYKRPGGASGSLTTTQT
jgi:hypothetical protein